MKYHSNLSNKEISQKDPCDSKVAIFLFFVFFVFCFCFCFFCLFDVTTRIAVLNLGFFLYKDFERL